MTAIAIIINNYLHDVATAILIASAALAWALDRAAARDAGGRSGDLLAAAYPRLVWVARVALVWIVLGGIPRTIFFTRFEWDPAVVRGIVPALVIKHVLMGAGVVAGSIMWLRIGARVRAGRPS
ncbi:MAG: hypothetical protein CVT59_11215 [Actinobacteria bacterium HGW-Actinobacteria-1]|jgi:hypothetical protein|nr:MAG: hypothetical protein CVT59_11215 [Actinobacteria bacterium HGW-Actinobacteria-1]